jgi:hypothetical protein
MIDTGASSTCIDDVTAQNLQLPVIDVVQMASASHATTQRNAYPAVVELVGFPIRLDVPRPIGAAPASQGLIAILGRDLLRYCTLHDSGP